MNNGSRVSQHKNERESEAKEKAELKRENRALRKQLTRLRRQVQKLIESNQMSVSDVVPADETETVKETRTTAGCQKCGSGNVAMVAIPSGTLVVCRDCQFRKRVEND